MTGMEMPDDVRQWFRQQGARGGKIGGKKRMESLTAEERSALAQRAAAAVTMTPEQRSARARKAAVARWQKKITKHPE